MSSGNRGKRASSLDWPLPLIGILLAVGLSWGVGYLQARETERRYQTSRQYQESAKASAERACVGMEAGASFECIEEKVEASHQQANTEQDLSAQQRAASSALAAAIISFLTLIISVFGVWFVKRTLDATLQAVEDTGHATEAMREANRIASEGNESQSRAWLDFELGKPELRISRGEIPLPTQGAHTPLMATVRNYGITPAFDVHIVGVMRLHGTFFKLPDLGPELDAEARSLQEIPGRIGSAAFPHEAIKITGSGTIDEATLAEFIRLRGDEAWITLAVRVCYTSAAVRKHTDHYFRIGGPVWEINSGDNAMQRSLDLTVTTPQQSVRPISGGTIT